MYWVCVARENRKAVLGICHGAQRVAHVCGGGVEKFDSRADQGLSEIKLTGKGESDQVSRPVKDRLVAQSHYYTIRLPEKAVKLAYSANATRPHPEAFRVRPKVYGLHFHPEPTANSLCCYGWSRRRPSCDEAKEAEQTGGEGLKAWTALARRGSG
jgi:GMP synthase-like glutamine amidotransferase